jgi:hypothetical protein
MSKGLEIPETESSWGVRNKSRSSLNNMRAKFGDMLDLRSTIMSGMSGGLQDQPLAVASTLER